MEDIVELREKLLNSIKVLSETTWEGNASRTKIDKWLENFVDDKERVHSLFLLSQFMYFNKLQMNELLKALYRDVYKYPIIEQIRRGNNDTLDSSLIATQFAQIEFNTKFVGIGNPSESGTHLLYFFRQVNDLSKKRFINAIEIIDRSAEKPSLRFKDVERYVFIDDFCGSGSQAKMYAPEVKFIKELKSDAIVSYLMLFATSKGLAEVKSSGIFDVVECLIELDDSFKCFNENSRYFSKSPQEINKDFAKSLCEKHGFELYKSIITKHNKFAEPQLSETAALHKLGYKDSQLLIGFFHNTPDNTLPIIWYDEKELPWYPIFKRYHKIY